MALTICGKMSRIGAMIGLTLAYFIVEIVVGHITGSIALVADSFHMLSDVVALAVGLAAVKISKMNSHKSTFGWIRAEVLGALVNAVFLLALCFTIFVDSIQRIVQKEDVTNPQLLLIVGAVGLGINILGLFIFHGHAHGHSHGGHSHDAKERRSLLEPDLTAAATTSPPHKNAGVAIVIHKGEDDDVSRDPCGSCSEDQSVDSASNSASNRHLNVDHPVMEQALPLSGTEAGLKTKHHHKHKHEKSHASSSSQLNMRGIFLHVLGDALGSVVVIISALLIWLVPDPEPEAGHVIEWKPYIDPALSLLLVGIIVTTTVPLLKESALILLQAVPTQLRIHEMKEALEKMDGVLAVHELHVWQLAGSRNIASLHLSVVCLEDYIRLSGRIKRYFHDNGVHSVTIQPEFEELHVKKEGRDCALECGPEKSCYTDTCCGKKLNNSASAGQNLLELISTGDPVTRGAAAEDASQLGAGGSTSQSATAKSFGAPPVVGGIATVSAAVAQAQE